MSRRDLKSLFRRCPLWLSSTAGVYRDYQQVHSMLKEDPKLAKEQFQCNAYGIRNHPLTFLLAARAPLGCIQEVYQMYPDALEISDSEGYLPLHDSIFYRCRSEIVSFLAKENPSALLKKTEAGDLPIDLLLNCLADTEFDEDDFTNNFQTFFDPDWKYLVANNDFERVFSKVMLSPKTPSKTLKWLGKQMAAENYWPLFLPDSWRKVESLIQNLKHLMPVLECKEICLNWLDDSMDGSFIAKLFTEVQIPATLAIHLVRCSFILPPHFENTIRSWGSCQVQELRITNCEMPANDWNCLLKSFQDLTNLKRLFLSVYKNTPGKVPCTDAVIDLLEVANLDQMFIIGKSLEINLGELSQALQKSTSTAFVGYIEEPSTYHGYDDTFDPPDCEIAYHSSMNRHGRTKITAPNATRKVLVDCLCSLQGIYEPQERMQKYDIPDNLVESLWYGLLREAPGLWASAASGLGSNNEKRRRIEGPLPIGQNSKKMKEGM